MNVTPEYVKTTIGQNAVDCMSAEDCNTGDKLGYFTGGPEVLQAAVDTLQESLSVPYRVRLWSSQVDKKRGAKPVNEKPFVFVLRGTAGHPAQPAPSNPSVNAAPAANVPLELAERAAKSTAEADFYKRELDAMRQRIEDMESTIAELEDEADTLSAAQPAPVVLKWYETESGGQMIRDLVKPISEAAAAWMRPKIPAPSPNQRLQAAPEETAIKPEEQRLVVAYRNFAAANPEMATALTADLLKFAPGYQEPESEQPAANG